MTSIDSADTHWICATCAVEYPATPAPPARCPVCDDERQYLPSDGVQKWTTMAELAVQHDVTFNEIEPGMWEMWTEPSVGIGQRSLLVITDHGNLLWDPIGLITDDAIARVHDLGGIAWIASSHPHMFGAQVSWSEAFTNAPIHVNGRDAEFIGRTSAAVTTWDEELALAPGLVVHRFGGHFPGSGAVHWSAADGKGVLLASDTIQPTPAAGWVSFMRSYPNRIPLSPAVVDRLVDRATALPFDRLYGNFRNQNILADAHDVIRRSAQRQNGWASGEFDHLT